MTEEKDPIEDYLEELGFRVIKKEYDATTSVEPYRDYFLIVFSENHPKQFIIRLPKTSPKHRDDFFYHIRLDDVDFYLQFNKLESLKAFLNRISPRVTKEEINKNKRLLIFYGNLMGIRYSFDIEPELNFFN